MSAIRGRLNQYKILSREPRLISTIVPTIRLTQSSLLSMLATYDSLVLKPVVGMQLIKIYKKNGVFTLWTNGTQHIVSNEEGIYEIIQQNIENQNYVIQPMDTNESFSNKTFHRLVTLQKKGERWEITSSTKITKNRNEGMLYLYRYPKIQKIAQLAAETLYVEYPNCETIVLEMGFNQQGDILIHDSYLHFSVSKWNQYQSIGNYMPLTDILTLATFRHFMLVNETIFLKPCNGQQGKGIIKITKSVGNNYEVQIGRTKWVKESLAELYLHLQKMLIFDDCYVIQQGIPLATIDDCVLDVRVLMQKVDGIWQVAGKVVKLAGKGFFITNAAQEILPLELATGQSTISSDYHSRLNDLLNQLCTTAALTLDLDHARTEIGFDVGITNDGELSIIEGNYRSDISMFHQLEDKTMYKAILNNRSVVKQPSR